MESVKNPEARRKVWVDGNTVVREAGEVIADDYLYGSGYQAKLTEFIKKRDAELAACNASMRPKSKVQEAQPGEE